MIEHTVRCQLGSPELTYRLTNAGLEVCHPQRGIKLIPYQTIHSVRLQFLGMVMGVEHYRCIIRSWEHRQLVIQNAHFVGIGRVEARHESYRRFVDALHRVLDRRDVPTRFTRGSLGLVITGWALVVMAALIILAALIVLGAKGIWLGAGLAPAIPYGMFLIHNSRRESYSPGNVPAELLPTVKLAGETARARGGIRQEAQAGC